MTLVNLAYCGIKDSQVWIKFTQKLDSRVLLLNNSTVYLESLNLFH